jgi:hypothetical protein
MRTTKRRRPLKRDRLAADKQIDVDGIADRVSYVLTPEHKGYLTAAGPGKLRSDASASPPPATRPRLRQGARLAAASH